MIATSSGRFGVGRLRLMGVQRQGTASFTLEMPVKKHAVRRFICYCFNCTNQLVARRSDTKEVAEELEGPPLNDSANQTK